MYSESYKGKQMNMRCCSFVVLSILLLSACTSIPEGVTPVKGFDKARYLGTWYEIARLDHSFERGLEQVTATYNLREDGGIDVLNKGFNPEKGEWKEAQGKAFFVGDPNVGHLKVSFFGPFYASYVIAELGEDKSGNVADNAAQDQYQYALVTGPDTNYLWILSRTPRLAQNITEQLVLSAQRYGFETSELIYVQHNE